jgi:hypothetical protein
MWTRRPLSCPATRAWVDPATTSASSRPSLDGSRLRVRPAQSIVRGSTLALLGVLLVSLAACGRSAAASSSDTRNLPNCQAPCLNQGNGGVVTTTKSNASGGVTTIPGGNPQASGSSVTTGPNAGTVTTRGHLPGCQEPCGTQPNGSPVTQPTTTGPTTTGPTTTTQLPPCQAPCGTQPNGNPVTTPVTDSPTASGDETTTTVARTGSSGP